MARVRLCVSAAMLVGAMIGGKSVAQNVGIGTLTPAASAKLEVVDANRGLLIPRVALTAVNNGTTPINAPATSLLVYNTNAAVTGGTGAGYYYWDGTQWVELMPSSSITNDWAILGNTGTNPATHFVGTTDAVDFVVRTANTEKMRVQSGGNVGIGITVPTQKLDVQNGNARINNTFVGDVGHGATWGGIAHSSQANTNGYALISSSDGAYTLINKNNTGSGYIGFRVANNDQAVILNNGNMGIGTTGPAHKLDIVGPGGANIELRTTGRIWTNSTDGGMWLSNLQDGFMGNISATQLGFWTSSVGWSAFNITKTNGYVGIGTTGPTSKLHVLADADNIPVIYGVNTNNTGGTQSYGVRGECGSSGLGSAGVSGVSTNGGQNEMGVLGDYAVWGASIFGLAWNAAYADMPASRDFGVFGTVNFGTGTGVYGRNTNTSGAAFGVYSFGNFAATGAKAASVPTSQGNQMLYCVESPGMWFEDLAEGQLVNGQAHISLDPLFIETVFIDATHPMHVFLQEQGNCQGLYFQADADGKGFTVFEKNGGTSNVSFSYRVMAKRRFYQDHRFGVDSNQPFENNLVKAVYQTPTTTDVETMRAMVKQAEDEKMALVKAQRNK